MIKLDMQLLDSIGLAELPIAEKKAILQHIYDSLETRVGARFASTMSDDQLDQFDELMKSQDDAAAFNFLQTKFPNYREIVQEEFEKLKNEVAGVAPQIVAESKQATASGAPAPQFAAPQPQPAVEAPQYPAPNVPQSAPAPEQTYQPQPATYQPPQPYQPAPPTFQPPAQLDFPSEQPPAGPGSLS